MASGRIWEKEHGDRSIFGQDPQKKKWLNKRAPELGEKVDIARMWPQLIAHGVVDRTKRCLIEKNAIEIEQVHRLLDHLQVSGEWRWHAFLRCLVLTDQEDILHSMGLELKNYTDESSSVAIPASLKPPSTAPVQPGARVAPSEHCQPAPVSASPPAQECPLWNPKHPDADTLLYEESVLERQLNAALPLLRKTVRIDDLWSNLLRYGAMDDSHIEGCKVGVAGEQVEKVVRYLKTDVIWKTHAFFRCLAEMKQEYLIDKVLGKGAKERYNKDIKA